MLEILRFVKGAVATRDIVQGTTHFAIRNGQIRSFNGTIALCSPIPLKLECTPKAVPFIKAIENCKDEGGVTLSMTQAGRLKVASGKFKAFIENLNEVDVHPSPEGEEFPIQGDVLLKAMKTLNAFIGDDASRPWSTGILFNGNVASATNNIIAVQAWLDDPFPIVCVIPKLALKEIIRINLPPVKAQVTDKNLTFHYKDERWIRTALLSTEWPNLDPILDGDGVQSELPEEFFQSLETIAPFTDDQGRIYFGDEQIATSLLADSGASYDLPNFCYNGCYNLDMLKKLKDVVKTINLNTYPKPCLFRGERMRGAIIGIRTFETEDEE